jgi:hypothetical protein
MPTWHHISGYAGEDDLNLSHNVDVCDLGASDHAGHGIAGVQHIQLEGGRYNDLSCVNAIRKGANTSSTTLRE